MVKLHCGFAKRTSPKMAEINFMDVQIDDMDWSNPSDHKALMSLMDKRIEDWKLVRYCKIDTEKEIVRIKLEDNRVS